MNFDEFKYKVQRKLYGYYYNYISKQPFEKYVRFVNFIAARPNPGAGIGHQLANWMAGYHLAKEFGLKFANIPFTRYHHPNVPTP